MSIFGNKKHRETLVEFVDRTTTMTNEEAAAQLRKLADNEAYFGNGEIKACLLGAMALERLGDE